MTESFSREEWVLAQLDALVEDGYTVVVYPPANPEVGTFVAAIEGTESCLTARGDTPSEALEVVLERREERGQL